MTARPAASVVVVNWNGGDLLQDCLRSLAADAEGAGPGGVEIVLVDNASEDGSAEVAQRTVDSLRVVQRQRNEGFAAGANAGIRASGGEFVVLVNNDARVEPGFLAAILEPMRRPGGEDVAAVTGRVLLADRYRPAPAGTGPDEGLVGHDGSRWVRVGPDEPGHRLLNSTGNLMTRSGNGRDRDWLSPEDSPPAAVDVFGFNGGCAALRRGALDQVGLLEASLFMYFEDTDLSWRLRRAGWRIVHAHGAVTQHQHAASSGTATAFFQIHNTRNRLLVALAQAPWPVVLRALARTLWRFAAGPHRGRTARAMGQALRMAPSALRRRRATDRSATVSRREVAGWLVPD
ncbi:glycosyltransferase family 2 protein [Blastococcus jejuensis]|uniref:Glycosyltransferase family 2 protein n=1 Tax=Blastococcus jejuensis TaxID=351224 RepID=A0ABP6NQR5_9ACTN